MKTSPIAYRLTPLSWLIPGAVALSVIAAAIPIGIRVCHQHAVLKAFDRGGNIVETRQLAPEWVIRAARHIVDDPKSWLSEVTSVDAGFDEIDDGALKLLSGLSSLEELRIERGTVSDAGFAHLSGMCGLRRLKLTDVALTDAGLRHLSSLHALEELEISHTGVSDEGLRNLAGFKKLQRLNLEATQITEAGLRHLSRLPNLRAIQLDETPVFVEVCDALARGDADWLKAAIIRTPALILAVDFAGDTLLQLAVQQDSFSPSVVRTLIDAGIDLEAKDIYGKTALELAATMRTVAHDDVFARVRFLLDCGAEYTLLAAIGANDLVRVQELLSNALPAIEQRSHMIEAIDLGRAALVGALIENWRLDLDQSDFTGAPLVCRATEHPEVLRVLLERGANPNSRIKPFIFCGFAHLDVVGDGTALHHAAANGYLDSAELLMGRGATIDAQDERGRTPLMEAVDHGHVAVLTLLVRHGADPTIRDAKGETAVTLALKQAAEDPLHWNSLVELLQSRCKGD